jgi:hypothetical protein
MIDQISLELRKDTKYLHFCVFVFFVFLCILCVFGSLSCGIRSGGRSGGWTMLQVILIALVTHRPTANRWLVALPVVGAPTGADRQLAIDLCRLPHLALMTGETELVLWVLLD